MGALRKGPYQAPGEQTAIIPGSGCGSVLPRAKLKRCRSFVIYLLLLQQVLRAIFLPHPSNPQLSFSLIFSICFHVLATVTCFPLQTQPCPRQIFKHFDLVIPSPVSLPSSCGHRDWNDCFVLASQTHKFKPASHVCRRQSAPCLFRAVLFLSFILSAGRDDLLEAGTRTSAY